VPEDIGIPVGLFGVEPFDGEPSEPEAPTPPSDEPAGTS
jgi:hypothetical protein